MKSELEIYRNAISLIRDMAASKKRINMQDGTSLETFCRQVILEASRHAEDENDPDAFIGEMP